MDIHKASRNKKYFMLKTKKLRMEGKKKVKEVFVGVTELDEKRKGQFKF